MKPKASKLKHGDIVVYKNYTNEEEYGVVVRHITKLKNKDHRERLRHHKKNFKGGDGTVLCFWFKDAERHEIGSWSAFSYIEDNCNFRLATEAEKILLVPKVDL